MVHWLPHYMFVPPHAVSHPDHVIELANKFFDAGWDVSKPALIGYPSPWEDKIQLLSGSHRWAAAVMTCTAIPCVLLTYAEVDAAWGNLNEWACLMKQGDGVLSGNVRDR